MRLLKRFFFVLPVVIAAGACSDTTGNGDTGQARVYMSRSSDFAAAAVEGAAMNYVASSMGGFVALSQVDSLFVKITSISAQRWQGADTAKSEADTSKANGSWVAIQLADSGGKRISLLKLPSEGQDSIPLARGELQPGTYKNIRLQFDSAIIVLKEDLRIGTFNFQKGTVYPLRVPSGVIKIPTASFQISADSLSTVKLLFGAESSVAKITATGAGALQISPVIHTRK